MTSSPSLVVNGIEIKPSDKASEADQTGGLSSLSKDAYNSEENTERAQTADNRGEQQVA